jgi:hypothetical protein
MKQYVLFGTSGLVVHLNDVHKEGLKKFKFPQIVKEHSINSYGDSIVVTEKGLYSVIFFRYLEVRSLNFKYLI